MEKKWEYSLADFHTHILPGVDDGASDLEHSMKMVAAAYESGTRILFLTPHFSRHFHGVSAVELRKIFKEFEDRVHQIYPDLRLILGNEIHYEMDTPDHLETGRCMTMGDSSYCLIEFRSGALASRILSAISELVRCGYTPVIAHAERYASIVQNPSLVEDAVSMGALIQLNADSILGMNGFRIKRLCAGLLKRRLVHFVGSDAHDISRRPPEVGKCMKKIVKKYGAAYAKEIFLDNPLAVINNESISEGDTYGISE